MVKNINKQRVNYELRNLGFLRTKKSLSLIKLKEIKRGKTNGIKTKSGEVVSKKLLGVLRMLSTTAITWGKIILLFQAVITLLIGIVFFLQITGLDKQGIQQFKIMVNEGISENNPEQIQQSFIDVGKRFEVAGYILLIVSLIEILIISRFMD